MEGLDSILGIERLDEVGVIQLGFAQTCTLCYGLQEVCEDDLKVWLSGSFNGRVKTAHLLNYVIFSGEDDEDFIHCRREALSNNAMPVAKEPAGEIELQLVALYAVKEPSRNCHASEARNQRGHYRDEDCFFCHWETWLVTATIKSNVMCTAKPAV